MKETTERIWTIGNNAWGGDGSCYRQRLMIEQEDIGKPRNNYLGHRQAAYIFKTDDSGREIEIMSDNSNWTCWSFVT